MDKFNKKYTAYLVMSIVMSVLFVAGIPGIIIFAGKVKALMIISIVVVAFGFYATPILWMTTGGLGGLKKVLVSVEEQHVYTVTELSSVLSIDRKEVTERVKKLLAGFYLEGYTFDGETLTKSTDLLRVRRRHEAGETLTLTYERGGKRYTAEVVLRESDT